MTVRRKEQNQILYIYGIFKEISIFYTKKKGGRNTGSKRQNGGYTVCSPLWVLYNKPSLPWVGTTEKEQ